MRRPLALNRYILVPMACTSAALAAPAQADEQDWATASTVVEIALVSAAVGTPVIEDDWQGVRQAGYSVGTAFVTTEVLKRTFPETRPDGSDRRSFPSGHTSLSFAAAATIADRQGQTAGIVAHVAAAFVGVARVQADKHYWHDVLVGAAIGEVAGRLLTTRPSENVAIMPWGDSHGGGVTLAARF